MPLLLLAVILLLLFVLQNYVYKTLWDRGLDYRAQFSAREAFEGDRLFLKEELSNKKFLPLPWVFVHFRLSEYLLFINPEGEPVPHNVPNNLYAVMSYTAIRRRKPFLCRKRGVYNLRSASLTAGNLLHTHEYEKDFPLHGELLVFPRLLDDCKQMDLLYRQLDTVVRSNRLNNPDPFEFRGLREYQPGDPLRFVNFKASAVAQQMMVNIHAPTAGQKLVLALNLEDMHAPGELHETAIRICATLAEHYLTQDAGVGFYTNGMSFPGTRHTDKSASLRTGSGGGHLYDIYACLARIVPGVLCTPMARYMDRLTDKEQVYIFISSYYEADIRESFRGLEERGVEAFMVVPAAIPISLAESKRTFLWEA
jgi:uncharacterized protein (DUF58 family)